MAVGGGGGRRGQWGPQAQCILDKAYEIRSQFLSLCCLILPYNTEKKRQPFTAGLTERQFQSPADRSRIRTRNIMYSNRAPVITWDCMSEINCKQSTVELQWLEHLRDQGNMFETGVVRASEC